MPNIGDKVRVIAGPNKSAELYAGLEGTVVKRHEFEQGAQNKILVKNEGFNQGILERARDYHTNAPEMTFYFNDFELQLANAVSEADKAAERMLAEGFKEVTEFKNLRVGLRVRHMSQRWSEAQDKGTGVIERIFIREGDNWSQTHGRPNVELIKKNDDDSFSYLADYHVEPAERQEKPEKDKKPKNGK